MVPIYFLVILIIPDSTPLGLNCIGFVLTVLKAVKYSTSTTYCVLGTFYIFDVKIILTEDGKMFVLSHACHEFFKSPLTVIFINKQHFFDCTLLEAHLIELSQKAQELRSLKDNLKE